MLETKYEYTILGDTRSDRLAEEILKHVMSNWELVVSILGRNEWGDRESQIILRRARGIHSEWRDNSRSRDLPVQTSEPEIHSKEEQLHIESNESPKKKRGWPKGKPRKKAVQTVTDQATSTENLDSNGQGTGTGVGVTS